VWYSTDGASKGHWVFPPVIHIKKAYRKFASYPLPSVYGLGAYENSDNHR